jgi:hypothetical protein
MAEPGSSDIKPTKGHIHQSPWTVVDQMKARRFPYPSLNDFFVIDFCPRIIYSAEPFDSLVPDHHLRIAVEKVMHRDPKIHSTK